MNTNQLEHDSELYTIKGPCGTRSDPRKVYIHSFANQQLLLHLLHLLVSTLTKFLHLVEALLHQHFSKKLAKSSILFHLSLI